MLVLRAQRLCLSSHQLSWDDFSLLISTEKLCTVPLLLNAKSSVASASSQPRNQSLRPRRDTCLSQTLTPHQAPPRLLAGLYSLLWNNLLWENLIRVIPGCCGLDQDCFAGVSVLCCEMTTMPAALPSPTGPGPLSTKHRRISFLTLKLLHSPCCAQSIPLLFLPAA